MHPFTSFFIVVFPQIMVTSLNFQQRMSLFFRSGNAAPTYCASNAVLFVNCRAGLVDNLAEGTVIESCMYNLTATAVSAIAVSRPFRWLSSFDPSITTAHGTLTAAFRLYHCMQLFFLVSRDYVEVVVCS